MYETNWLPRRDAARRGDPLTPQVLAFEPEAAAARIAARLRDRVQLLRRRGAVLGFSGGVDSSVCAALAVKALGPDRVFGLLLPERDSSPASASAAGEVARGLGIATRTEDITAALESVGAYTWRDEAIRRVFPAYGDGWRNKIVIAGASGMRYFKLVVQAPDGAVQEKRLPHREYLQIVAATNYKQRVRKTIEYFHADRLHFAVIGTPNRLEYDQGFFVKNGDGSADVKPIAHLYKTQVYALARHLGLPEAVCAGSPSTDTYSLAQGQDEFYFALPYQQMDLALWAHNHDVPAGELAAALSLSESEATAVYRDIEAKRQATAYQHAAPLLVEAIHELPHLDD